ncbi:MAG: hypothetical protein FWG98_13800 [Candidatus Cloacimonetes bacterium]|nr:hypothetical protein [Candidatus Cloacimonadota bacterium]
MEKRRIFDMPKCEMISSGLCKICGLWIILFTMIACSQANQLARGEKNTIESDIQTKETISEYLINKGGVVYDFSFVYLALEYIETGDTRYLDEIAELDATTHMFPHANHFGYHGPHESRIELVTYLLSPLEEHRERLDFYERNLRFAKEHIAETNFAQGIALEYLPEHFSLSGSMFFTIGFYEGVAHENTCSLDLDISHYMEHLEDMKYSAIHELHHIGFIPLKGYMPSLNLSTYAEMAHLIEYLTQLEGMATYAPLEIRQKENAMSSHSDSIDLQNSELMVVLEKEFFEIYFYFKNDSDELITDEDWEKLYILADGKRLWYIVGAYMAKTMDIKLGREKLVSLIAKPSVEFINAYLSIK